MSLWNLTIDDTSPFFTYFPYADGSNSGLTKGWTPWYTQSGFITTNGEGGAGDSYHITSLPGASVTLNFYGSAAFFYGTSNSSYDATVDNQPYTHDDPTSDLLLAVNDLKEGTHSVAIFARPSSSSQQLAFDRAVISTPLINNQIPSELFYDNMDTTMFKYTGTWASATAPGIPNSTVTHPWEETFTLGAYVELDIDIGAVGVSLWGMTNWGNWLYSVTLDGLVNQYNGSTFWKVPDAMLFYAGGLDPTKTHKLVITNDSSMKLALNSLRVYNIFNIATTPGTSSEPIPNTGSTPILGTGSTPLPGTGSALANTSTAPSSSKTGVTVGPAPASTSTPSAHSSSKTGIIVGPIVAVVVLGLAGSMLWWRFRNRLQTPSHGHISVFTGHVGQNPEVAFKSYPVTSTTPTSPLTSSVSKSRVISPVVSPSSPHGASQAPGMARSNSHPTRPPVSSSLDETIAPPPQPLVSDALETPDLDRLIEWIAQRIDRNPRSNDNTSPPEYRG